MLIKFLHLIFLKIYNLASFVFFFLFRIFRSETVQNYLDLRKSQQLSPTDILVHCASLGEYQSLIPILKRIKMEVPNKKITVSFFSPSGYEYAANDGLFYYKVYSPIDVKSEVKYFFDCLKPTLVIISQNEIWPCTLSEVVNRKIPFLYVDSYFTNTAKTKFWIWLNQYILSKAECFFVQNEQTGHFLETSLAASIEYVGSIRREFIEQSLMDVESLPKIEKWSNQRPLIVFGSVHSSDIAILSRIINDIIEKYNILIAPHDLDENNLSFIKKSLSEFSLSFYSKEKIGDNRICILDQFGVLKYAYKYADIVYMGGGFDQGIHNVTEPAYFQKPIISGPNFTKFNEAVVLYDNKVLNKISTSSELILAVENIMENEEDIKNYYARIGPLDHSPSESVMNFIKSKGLIKA